MPQRTKPLDRSSSLRRAALVRHPKTTVGEFSPRVRLLLWLRFAGLCVVCGLPLPRRGWTGQHRRSRGMGGSADPATVGAANGLAVHELPCHRRIEDNPAASLIFGWRVPQGTDPAAVPVRTWDGRWVLLTADGGYTEEAA